MEAGDIAKELASGGAYTAWFIAVTLSGVVVLLYREVRRLNKEIVKAYKEDDSEVLANQASIIRTQMEHTTILSTILGILRGGR